MRFDFHLTHFQALLIFALCISLGMGFLSESTVRGRAAETLRVFALFVVIGVAVAWMLYPFSH
jgi:hypothetical protein